jgi:hypothetical protein
MGVITLSYYVTKNHFYVCENCGKSPIRIVVYNVRYRGWFGGDWKNEQYTFGVNGNLHLFCSKRCAREYFGDNHDIEFEQVRKRDSMWASMIQL